MKKTLHYAIGVLLACLLVGCASTPISSNTPGVQSLDESIRLAAARMESQIPGGTQIALINVFSPAQQFSDYTLTYLESILVNNGKLIVVDRSNLDKIRQEQGFQLSGEVSDESAKAIGKMLGAGAIVTGSLMNLGDSWRLTLKAINVETATVAASFPADVANDARMQFLLKASTQVTPASASKSSQDKTTSASTLVIQQEPETQTAPAQYKLGDIGPAGGIVFFDKGNSSGGWRYLEAAPENTEKMALYPFYSNNEVVGSRKVGDGKENTQKFMTLFAAKGGGINSAPWLCDQLVVNGFDDWYLPSQDELLYLYNNLFSKDLGGFKRTEYCSSYVNGGLLFLTVDFSDGSEKTPYWSNTKKYSVRAIRRF